MGMRHRIRLLRALILGCHLANSNDGPPSHPIKHPTEKWRQKKTLRIVPFFVNVNVLQTKTHSHLFRKKYWLRLVSCYVFFNKSREKYTIGSTEKSQVQLTNSCSSHRSDTFSSSHLPGSYFCTDVSGTFGSIQPISMNKHARSSSFWPLCSLQQVWGQKFKQVFETTYPYQL